MPEILPELLKFQNTRNSRGNSRSKLLKYPNDYFSMKIKILQSSNFHAVNGKQQFTHQRPLNPLKISANKGSNNI